MRLDDPAVLKHTGFEAGAKPEDVISKLREQKNKYVVSESFSFVGGC